MIPVWYGRPFLRDTLASVYRQEGAKLKVVVVEDGTPPPHDAADLVQEFPVHYVALPTNQGVARARQRGAALCISEVDALAFLDQDDAWEPGFLQVALQSLAENPQVGFVVSEAWVESDRTPPHLLYGRRRPSLTLPDLAVANQIASPSQVLMRAQAYRTLPVLPELAHPGSDDWLLWLLLLAAGWQGTYLPDPWVCYRDHAGGAHRRRALMRRSDREVVERWFPRLGLEAKWVARHRGREAVDRVWQIWHRWGWQAGLKALYQELGSHRTALLWALGFRLRHRLLGLV